MKNTFPRLRAAWPLAGISLALIATIASAQGAPAAVEAKPVAAASADAARTAAPVAQNAGAPAQDGMPQATAEEDALYDEAPPLQVGDAATGLLAWQRDGAIASPTARPIAGDVARRSYERYLKSFEYPIPERLNSTVKTGGNSSSGSR
jgi:hypothetical protein